MDSIILIETTKSFPEHLRHTYIVSKDKQTLYGYIPNGQTLPRLLNKPLKFNYKGRTFNTVKVK